MLFRYVCLTFRSSGHLHLLVSCSTFYECSSLHMLQGTFFNNSRTNYKIYSLIANKLKRYDGCSDRDPPIPGGCPIQWATYKYQLNHQITFFEIILLNSHIFVKLKTLKMQFCFEIGQLEYIQRRWQKWPIETWPDSWLCLL